MGRRDHVQGYHKLIFMVNVAAADSRLPFGYRAGDSFSCISDALITIGADGEIIEYKNEAFGMQINQNNTVNFSQGYPLNPFGKIVEFSVINLGTEMKLEVGDFVFAYFKKKTPEQYTLTGFSMMTLPTIIHADCEAMRT